MLYDMRQKKEEIARLFCILTEETNQNVENKTGILYNDIVYQLKGM